MFMKPHTLDDSAAATDRRVVRDRLNRMFIANLYPVGLVVAGGYAIYMVWSVLGYGEAMDRHGWVVLVVAMASSLLIGLAAGRRLLHPRHAPLYNVLLVVPLLIDAINDSWSHRHDHSTGFLELVLIGIGFTCLSIPVFVLLMTTAAAAWIVTTVAAGWSEAWSQASVHVLTGGTVGAVLFATRYQSLCRLELERLELERARELLRDRLAFESLITKLSTRFISTDTSRIDEQVTEALGEIGAFAGVGRSYIFQFSDDRSMVEATHEWCAPGVTPSGRSGRPFPVADLPWIMPRHLRQETVHVPRIDQLPPQASAERAAFEAQGIKSLLAVPLASSEGLIGFVGFDSVADHKHWSDELILLLRIVGEMFTNALQRRRAERALSDAAERFRLVTLATYDAIYDWHVQENRSWRNVVLESHFGLPSNLDGSGPSWPERIHRDDHDRVIRSLHEAFDRQVRQWSAEYRLLRADGQFADVIDRGYILYDAAGRPVRMIGAVTDITDRKQAEQRQRLMMHELDHRVKNNLAAVVSLAEQTVRASDSLQAFRQTFLGRLRAMARTHEALAQSRWRGADLGRVAALVLEPLDGGELRRIDLDGPAMMLPASATLPICLTLNELATNAVKHGAMSAATGRVSLSWRRDERGNLLLRWAEHGGPPAIDPPVPGTGLRLIEGLIAYQLKGTVAIDPGEGGIVCRLTIPLENLDDPAADAHISTGGPDAAEDHLPRPLRPAAR